MTEPATLLFVDDEERILRSLRLLFKPRYKVLTTTDGREALDMVRRERVHVIVSDQRMPIMAGVDLLREVKELSPNTMRILLTGYSDLAAVVGSVNDGEIFRYIHKPWTPAEIQAAVDKAAEIALALMGAPATADAPAVETVEPRTRPATGLLVIDDDPATCDTIKEIARGEYEVFWSADLEAAFETLGARDIGIVICDVKLGGEDITGAIKTLKRHNPDILTIVLTSFQDTGAIIGLINHGQVFRFLPKPARKGLLERSIGAGLRHHRALRTAPRLAARHAVEVSADAADLRVAERIMGYLRKIRSRLEGNAAGSWS